MGLHPGEVRVFGREYPVYIPPCIDERGPDRRTRTGKMAKRRS